MPHACFQFFSILINLFSLMQLDHEPLDARNRIRSNWEIYILWLGFEAKTHPKCRLPGYDFYGNSCDWPRLGLYQNPLASCDSFLFIVVLITRCHFAHAGVDTIRSYFLSSFMEAQEAWLNYDITENAFSLRWKVSRTCFPLRVAETLGVSEDMAGTGASVQEDAV